MTEDKIIRENQFDVALMRELAEGKPSALDALMDRHYRRVFNIANRYLGNEADAEEAAQEVFIRVFNSAQNYRPEAKFTTWLYTITSRLCFNMLRDRKRHREVAMGDNEMRLFHEPMGVDPINLVTSGELRRIVKNAVGELPDKQRMAVILNKWEGLSYEEIAAAMEMTAAAVKSLLSRARENLSKKLIGYVGKS